VGGRRGRQAEARSRVIAAVLAALAVGASDLTLLQQQLPQIYPAPAPKEFVAAADDLRARLPELDANQAAVGFMRLVASLGERNGHTGIFPLDPGNRRAFHEYPLLPYEFPEGPVVVGQLGGADLVGARIESVGGLPIDQVLERVRPLVPRDNDSSLRARRPQYLMSAEVLDGLGIAPRFGFVLRNGTKVERTLTPVSAAAYSRAFDGFHLLPKVRAGTRLATLAGGRVVYFVYNNTLEFVGDDAAKLLKLASKPKVKRIVVDVRNNGGGDNHTYPVLIDALRRLAKMQHKQIVVLAGRVTFSAAVNFLGDLEASTRFLLVGEDSGGAPNLYGDATPLDLPQTGLRVEIATVWWVKSRLGANDPRLTFHPDVVVEPTAAQWLAGRDPALAAALTAPFAKARAVH
jgi:hypothetical protein